MSQATGFDPYAMPADALRSRLKVFGGAEQIGPGIILAGSIIGTGELLLTTGLGAKYGFAFLGLILFSCVIKVFVQVELGRYAISSGKPTLGALDELPGWRLGAHWLVWWWFLMLLATISQLGAMVGGVGQASHSLFPHASPWLADKLANRLPGLAEAIDSHPAHPWAVLTALVAIGLLLSGGYRRIEVVTTILVVGVTAVTVACVLSLPFTGFSIDFDEVLTGLLTYSFPSAGIAAAFGAFGITGVGASELYSYPYWCLEKGYARSAGPRTADAQWARRARGWMRVLKLDAWVSMVVFTVATVSFYFMGAVVLHQLGLHPEGENMMDQLAEMYVKAFKHPWTKVLFLLGGCAVLFKTLYVASAGHSRLTADFLSLARLVHYSEPRKRARWIRFFCVFYPALALILYLYFRQPQAMVVFGGFVQAATLPVITAATIYLRFRRTDPRLAPSKFSDVCLWFAGIAITLVACYAIWDVLSHWVKVVGDAHTQSNVIVAKVNGVARDHETHSSTPPHDDAVSRSSLETACYGTAADIAERLGAGCAAIVHAPFVVAGNLDPEELERWYQETIGPAARAMAKSYFNALPHEPITVLLFSGRADYDRQARSLYRDEGISVYGYYKPDDRTLVMNIGTGGGTLVHELTHALIDFDSPEVPDWFDEGLASLHERCSIRRDESGIDGLVNWRLPGLQKTIRAGRLRSLDTMIHDDDFRGAEVGLNYAHARYFCLFLQSDRNPRHRDVLSEFYVALRAQHPNDPQGLAVVRQVFPDQTWAQLNAAFRDFVLSLKP